MLDGRPAPTQSITRSIIFLIRAILPIELSCSWARDGGQGTTIDILRCAAVSNDTLISIENVTGTAGPDEFIGNEQANVLDGREGNDFLDGGFENDTLIGGSGNDTVSYASHSSVAGETAPFPWEPTAQTGLAQYSTAAPTNSWKRTSLRHRKRHGSSLDELIVGNEQNNILDGGFGNDRLVGGAGSDTASYVSHDGGTTLLGERDTISLGLNGANGSYARWVVTFSLLVVQFQTVETDVLVGDIQNVTGSNHSETINGNKQDNVWKAAAAMTSSMAAPATIPTFSMGGNQGNDMLFDSGGADHILSTDAADFKMARRRP